MIHFLYYLFNFYLCCVFFFFFFFFFQAEDGIRDRNVTGVQTCALPISTAVTSPLSACGTTSRIHGSEASCLQQSFSIARAPAPSTPASLTRCRARSRSEERRVGKECRSRWSPDHQKKKEKTKSKEHIEK